MLKNNYYFSSFFWSTLQKILNAVLGFISVPLLLGYYGKAEYGILAIATACNGYMHLLDLGMNTGAIKFFSQWKAEGRQDIIYRVARTNITFYLIIACVNILGLIALAIWGESIFSVTHEQFLQLRMCLYIIAIFSVFSWGTTTFNQLLIADKQMAYTMQVQCVQTILKTLLIFVVLWANLSLTVYFFWLTAILALLLVPYAIKCRRDNLIDSLKPATYWKDFKIVLAFSLSIFALSLFQMTATQSRPIVLSIFSKNGAETVSEFRIIEVIPTFIIMICGTLSSVFLPKTSEMVVSGNRAEINRFAYRGTVLTSILATILCLPFILGSKEILVAYMGAGYAYLHYWLIVWVLLALFQIHSAPANALILAYGRTKELVVVSAVACIISIIMNAMLAKSIGMGSAIVGYSIYIIINLSCYYIFFYKKLLLVNRSRIFTAFLVPFIVGVLSLLITYFITYKIELLIVNERLQQIVLFLIKSGIWLIIYILLLSGLRVIRLNNKYIKTFLE